MDDQVENANLTVGPISFKCWAEVLKIITYPSTLEAFSTVCKGLRRICFERMLALAKYDEC